MELLVLILLIALSGFIVGGLARLAVPGPDPMPWWQTILLGVAGSMVGGVLAAVFGMDANEAGDAAYGFLLSLAGATILLILYRRFVQGRTITGPRARSRP